jgi:hypothetical protein
MTFHRGFPIQGDLELTADGRDLVLVDGPEKVRQNIRVRASIFKGSWRYDRTKGMPYFDEILVAGASVELIRRRFYDMLIQTPGVLSVRKLTIRIDPSAQGATLYVDFAVTVDAGTLTDTLDFLAAA